MARFKELPGAPPPGPLPGYALQFIFLFWPPPQNSWRGLCTVKYECGNGAYLCPEAKKIQFQNFDF
ncbi:MAG: hypothetical protein CMB97_01430 [Flavobacteriaceae bacterium]|nr:hypothetical protein [Flavobacteriaceae bacterium]